MITRWLDVTIVCFSFLLSVLLLLSSSHMPFHLNFMCCICLVSLRTYDWDIVWKSTILGSVTVPLVSEDQIGAVWYTLDSPSRQDLFRPPSNAANKKSILSSKTQTQSLGSGGQELKLVCIISYLSLD